VRSGNAGAQGGPILVFLTLALLTAAVTSGAVLLAGCGAAQPAGSTALGPGASDSSAGGPGAMGTVGQTTAPSAPVTATSASAPTKTTAFPVTSPTPTAEAAVPVGEQARVGAWEITVVSVTAPATELIAYTNEFNEPPRPGFEYVVVTVKATYAGEDPAEFFLDIASTFVGSEGGEYGAPQGRAIAPQPIEDAGAVVPGGTASGDLVFEVSSAEMAGGMVALAPASSPKAAVRFATR
jgi:hypothetical protein